MHLTNKGGKASDSLVFTTAGVNAGAPACGIETTADMIEAGASIINPIDSWSISEASKRCSESVSFDGCDPPHGRPENRRMRYGPYLSNEGGAEPKIRLNGIVCGIKDKEKGAANTKRNKMCIFGVSTVAFDWRSI
jgi:hypothetical protein